MDRKLWWCCPVTQRDVDCVRLNIKYRWNNYRTHIYLAVVCMLVHITQSQAAAEVWIPGWESASSMLVDRAGAAVVADGDRLYVLGGVDGRIFLSSVETAEINADGSLTEWQMSRPMPQPRGFSSAVIFNKRVYVLGGGNGAYGKNLLKTIVSAPIDDDGSLGIWRTEGEQMLIPRRCSKLFIHENFLYTLGGFGGALLDSIERSEFGGNGILGEWSLSANPLTRSRYVNSVSKIDNYVFAIGGHHESKGIGLKSVEVADLLIGHPFKWQATHELNQGRYAFSSVVHGGTLYSLGGISGSEYLKSIESLSLAKGLPNASWRYTTDLPQKLANFTALVVADRVYLIGGTTGIDYHSQVWYSGFNNDGDIGFWGSKLQYQAYVQAVERKPKSNLPNNGVLIDSIETDSYRYMLVDVKGKLVWLAAPNNRIKKNQNVRFSEGVYMSNFFSKSLKRNFDAILFVGTVEGE